MGFHGLKVAIAMRWHYGMTALLGLVVGWGSVSLGRHFARFLAWHAAPVRIEPFVLSLGDLVAGKNVPFTVCLINRTDQTLRLVRVNYSVCGCFFERQKLPEIVPPHTKLRVAFGLKTEFLSDRFHERLTFILTDPSGKTFTPTVTLTGNVRREIAINPAFLDFGTVILGGGLPIFSLCKT